MAREIIVHLWCDPCLAEDQRVEGQELPPLVLPEVPGNRPRVAAVCERHRKELYQPLIDLLTEHGQALDEDGNPTGPRGGSYGKAKGDKAMTCPECGHTSPNKGALSSHVRNMHDTTLAELLGEATLPCPECGQKCGRPQGLAAHRLRSHGVTAEQRRAEEAEAGLFDQGPEEATKAPAKKAAARGRKRG